MKLSNMNDEVQTAARAALDPVLKNAIILAVIGAAIGLGQALTDRTGPVTVKYALGRALTSSGMAVCAAGAVAWIPEMPFWAQMGLGAMLASLGTSGVTALLQRFITK